MFRVFTLTAVLMSSVAFAGDDSPGLALTGHLEGYLGRANIAETGVWSGGGVARLNATFDQRWNGEGEIFIDRLFNSEGNLNAYGGAAHIYWRDPSAFAVGAFASINGLSGNGVHFANHFRVGPEFQIYTDSATFYGQAWYGLEQDVGGSDKMTEVGARAMVRYYPTENIRLDGELSYLDVNNNWIDAAGIIGAVQANYRFTDKPWTVFGRYQIDHPMQDAEFVGDLHRFNLGLRFSFGSSSIKDEDRNGAGMEAPTRIIHFFAKS